LNDVVSIILYRILLHANNEDSTIWIYPIEFIINLVSSILLGIAIGIFTSFVLPLYHF